jgi:sugar (pentulose or hexulose) kinase
MTRCLLGVDAGTTTITVVAFDVGGDERARAGRDNPVRHPRAEWAEQDMATTWERTAAAIREVVTALPADDEVVGVGVTGQGGGCWLLDADGEPVRNAILWTDGRASDVVERWRDDGTSAALFDRCGYGAFPGMALPIVRWLRDHDPDALDRAATIVACKDWIRSRLTGTVGSDPTDMSLVHHDVRGTGYRADALELADVPSVERLEPRLDTPTSVVGEVTDAAASVTGLPGGTPVVAGTMDVAASAYGSGAYDPGEGSTVVGTTLQNQVLLERPRIVGPPTGYTLDLGVDGRGLRAMGAMAGTPNLDWVRREVAEADDFAAVERAARSVPAGADGLVYHPYLSGAGEKAPFVDPAARAQFSGLDPSHTRDHLLRAVYEGVALAARDCYASLPVSPSTVTVSGGGARSTFWCRLFADCLDTTVRVPADGELGAKGAAALAAVGVGQYPDLGVAIAAMSDVATTYAPRSGTVPLYDDLYAYYDAVSTAMTDAWSRRRSVAESFDAVDE